MKEMGDFMIKEIKVIINNLEWTIKLVNDEDITDDNMGTTSLPNQLIKVRMNMKASQIKSTLTHELMHAYMYSYGLAYSGDMSHEFVVEFIACNIDNINNIRNYCIEKLGL